MITAHCSALCSADRPLHVNTKLNKNTKKKLKVATLIWLYVTRLLQVWQVCPDIRPVTHYYCYWLHTDNPCGVCWSLESRGPRPRLRWVSTGPARGLWAAHWAELSFVWDASSVGHTSRRSGDCHNFVTLSRSQHIASQTSDQSLVFIRTLVVIR